MATGDAPRGPLARRDVQLRLLDDLSARQADEGHVVDAVALGDRVASGDDGEAVPSRELAHEPTESGLVAGEAPDPLERRVDALLREELCGNELREQHEVGAVLGCDLHEVGDLLYEILEGAYLPHLVLHAGDARFSMALRRTPIVGIEPLDQAREVLAHRIGDVMRHHAAQDESFAQLKAQHLVLQLSGRHTLGVLLG